MEPTTTPTAPRPVMDIRPNRPTPQPLPRADFAPTPAPAPQQPLVPAPSPITPELPEQQHEVQPTPTIFPAELPKVKTPHAAIIIAILVGASLIGLTIFGYMKSQDKPDVAAPATTTEETVTAADVDESVTATDAALDAMNDSADFDEAALSDDSLGL